MSLFYQISIKVPRNFNGDEVKENLNILLKDYLEDGHSLQKGEKQIALAGQKVRKRKERNQKFN